MMNTRIAYVYDEDGYLDYACQVQESPLEPGVWLKPERSTMVAPVVNDGVFCRWNDVEEKWEYEQKPTKPEDFEGVAISHTSETPHCKELRRLIQSIVDTSCVTHRIVRGEALEWMVEKIPEKTEEQKLEEAATSVRQKRDYLLSQTDYLLAADYPISTEDLEEVKAYRQALRDVPQQQGFPNDVVWPDVPAIL